MADLSVVYDDFSGGEYGTLGGRKAPDGTWTGRNMRVYRNGSIGVRPGLKDLNLSNVTSGDLLGLAYVPFGGTELWYVINDDVRMVPFLDAGVASSYGTLSGVPASIIRVSESTRRLDAKVYFQVHGQSAYYTDPSGGTTTAVSNAASGRSLELYKDRLVAAGNGNRIVYSAAADFTTWDPAAFIDFGYEYPAYHLVAHRDGLSILAQALIWRITGTLGSTDVLRRASGAIPVNTGDAVLEGDVVYYTPAVRSAPVVWDGSFADERRLAHLEWYDIDATDVVSGGIARRYADILFGDDNQHGLWRSSGAWTMHTWGVNTSGLLTRAGSDKFVIAGSSNPATFYVLDASLDRPGFTTDDYAQPGDNSTAQLAGSLTLPEFWDKQGRQLLVRRIVVNYTAWNTGGATTNHFDISVSALDRSGGAAALASGTQSFDAAGSAASTTGKDGQAIFTVGDQGPGGAFQLNLTNIRGVAIRDITVDVEVRPSRSV